MVLRTLHGGLRCCRGGQEAPIAAPRRFLSPRDRQRIRELRDEPIEATRRRLQELQRKLAVHHRALERERDERDRRRVHLRQLAARVLAWSAARAPSALLTPLATFAAEIEALHQELERQRTRHVGVVCEAERAAFRRGFVCGKRHGG